MFTSLNDVSKALCDNLDPSDDYKVAEDLVQSLGRKQQVLALIESILRNDRQLEEIASRSYHHVNGFDKNVLVVSHKPKYELRLNIWWPKVCQEDHKEDIHNHLCDLTACLITGGYKHQIFLPSDTGDSFYKYICMRRRDGVGTFLEYQGQALVRQTFSNTMLAGCFYRLHSGILHRVENIPGCLTSTILIQGPFRQDYTDVYQYELSDVGNKPNKVFSPQEFEQKLKDYINHLKG